MTLQTLVNRHATATDAWTSLIKNIGREEAYVIVWDMLQTHQNEWGWWTMDDLGNSPKGIG